MRITEYRKRAGLTQKQFCELFNPAIPLDTVKNWDCGRKTPPDWVEGLIIEKLERIISKEEQ
jgi:DNA-binding transcriptional regulator YiaG